MMLRGLVVVMLLAMVASPDPRAWPTTYEPTTMTLTQLMAAVHAADGDTTRPARETVDVHGAGLTTDIRYVWRGEDYRVDEGSGPFSSAYGRFGGQRWILLQNGYTLLQRGLHRRSEVNARALEHADEGDDVTLLGRLRTPVDAYVVRVSPPDGRNERRYYDAANFHLIRREVAYPGEVDITTYSDYRTVHGTTLAFHTLTTDGHPDNDFETFVRSITFDAPVDKSEVEIPDGRRNPVQFPPGVDVVHLPVRMTRSGAIIVRVTINGRGLDFQLDSGSSGIIIDRAVADELNLPVHGKYDQTIAGTYEGGQALIPQMNIGDITMNDVVVDTAPFTYDAEAQTKVVGLLGFDFLAGGVFKIDYENGTVDMMRYDAPLPKDALVTDAVLDDRVPIIPVWVNGALGPHFILDTGADEVVFYSGFAKRNAAVLKDHGLGRQLDWYWDYPTATGVGGEIKSRLFIADKIQLGHYAFNKFLALILTGEQPAFEGEDTDGLIGATVLSAFDVYLDYANSRVAFVLNKSGKKGHPARGVDD